MAIVTTATINIDELVRGMSELQVKSLAGELLARVTGPDGMPEPVVIRDERERPVACLVPVPHEIQVTDEAAFIAELKRRVLNPPERYLTIDEFIAAITKKD